MEPVGRANQSSQQLNERISARDMRHLVAQNNASMLLVPIERFLRKKDDRRAGPPGERGADNGAGGQPHFACDTGLSPSGVENSPPIRRCEWPRVSSDTPKSHSAYD